MSARAQQDRQVVALAAVACGRLAGALSVRADRGQCSAQADQYRVVVTEPGLGATSGRGFGGPAGAEVVLEHWGGDAEFLALQTPLTGPVGLPAATQRARTAARMFTYYDLDALQIEYPDGVRLAATPGGVVLRGPGRGLLRRRRRLLRASAQELLQHH